MDGWNGWINRTNGFWMGGDRVSVLYNLNHVCLSFTARVRSLLCICLSPSHMLGGEDGEGAGFEVLCASLDGLDSLSCIKVILLLSLIILWRFGVG
jgi:hypothetical protein